MASTCVGRKLARLVNVAVLVASGMALSGATTLAQTTVARQQGESVAVGEWAQRVWSSAQSGDAESAFDLIARLPKEDQAPAIRALRESLDTRNAHIEEAEQARVARLAEARGELEKHMEAGELLAALRSAVELHAISRDGEKTTLLNDPAVKNVVSRSEAAAREAETKGDWLDSQELFYRLHLLFEEDSRYKADVERVGQRLMMLRLYTPERLHDMRNQQRVREGEDELPPFNAIGEDWREKLGDINMRMVVLALNQASVGHVDQTGMSEMLKGGLHALRTMVTTTDLAEAFPSLAVAKARNEFIRELDAEIARAEQKGGKAGYYDLRKALETVSSANNRTVQIPEEALVHEFGNGAMSRLDEFSAMIWPDELRRFQRSTEGRFTGIGVQIQLDDAMQLTVVTPLEGTPAQQAGVRKGDIIREVNGESTLGISLNQAVDRITGEPGTKVTLSVERPGAPERMTFDLTRAVIPIYSVKGWKRTGPRETEWDWLIDPENRIGYIRLTQFTEETTREMVQAIGQMRRSGLNGLIVDLRFNPGGLLSEAVSIANLFVDEGLIVSQHDALGIERDAQRARPGFALLADLPVVVLVNEGSASASEIVAGCLQDYERALVLGARTFGKGSVQNVYPINQGRAMLKLTTQYYRLPKGRLIHRRDGQSRWGVEPDVVVSMTPKQINDAITLRMDADVMPIGDDGKVLEDADRANPERLLTEGLDPQLETALLLLRSQSIAKQSGHAMVGRVQLLPGS